MSSSITRISDLPENNSMNSQSGNNRNNGVNGRNPNGRSGGNGDGGANAQSGMGANTYMPINSHTNPYGIPENNSIPGYPVHQGADTNNESDAMRGFPQFNTGSGGGGRYEDGESSPEFRLPSRDIPSTNNNYMHDDEVHANYIPKKKTSDYIREFEENEERHIKKHENVKKRTMQSDDFFTLIQIPVMIASLFFLFHLGIVNYMMSKYLSFLSIYKSDGTMNVYGIFTKSVLFGGAYFGINEMIQYLSSI